MPTQSSNVPRRLQSAVALAMLLCGTWCDAQVPASAPDVSAQMVSDPRLTRDLRSATAGSVGERCEALKRMGEYWSRKRIGPGRFTDLPAVTPRPAAKAIPAVDLVAIATLLAAAIADSRHEVREAAAICLCDAPRASPAVNAAIAMALITVTDLRRFW